MDGLLGSSLNSPELLTLLKDKSVQCKNIYGNGSFSVSGFRFLIFANWQFTAADFPTRCQMHDAIYPVIDNTMQISILTAYTSPSNPPYTCIGPTIIGSIINNTFSTQNGSRLSFFGSVFMIP